MSVLDHAEVVAITEGMPTEEWLERRREGLGGSDISVLYGINRYKTHEGLRLEKLGLGGPDTAGIAAKAGHFLERGVAEWYAWQSGDALVWWPVLLRSKEYPWMLCNLDFVIVRPSEQFPAGKVTDWVSVEEPGGILAVYEGKTTAICSRGNKTGWANGAVPVDYELQGAHYAQAVGLVRVVFACLAPPLGLLIRERDYENGEELVRREREFWESLESARPEKEL